MIRPHLGDQPFNTGTMKVGLLRRELVYLFTKYNIATKLYTNDTVLVNLILQSHQFDVTSSMYTSILLHGEGQRVHSTFEDSQASANPVVPHCPNLSEPRGCSQLTLEPDAWSPSLT